MTKTSSEIRFDFSVERCEDTATIAMNCGHVTRVRTMPVELLGALGELCRCLLERLADRMPADADIPDYPRFLKVCEGGVVGVCDAIMGLHRLDGRVERVIAFYDEGDTQAPVLVLVEEQIEEFLAKLEA